MSTIQSDTIATQPTGTGTAISFPPPAIGSHRPVRVGVIGLATSGKTFLLWAISKSASGARDPLWSFEIRDSATRLLAGAKAKDIRATVAGTWWKVICERQPSEFAELQMHDYGGEQIFAAFTNLLERDPTKHYGITKDDVEALVGIIAECDALIIAVDTTSPLTTSLQASNDVKAKRMERQDELLEGLLRHIADRLNPKRLGIARVAKPLAVVFTKLDQIDPDTLEVNSTQVEFAQQAKESFKSLFAIIDPARRARRFSNVRFFGTIAQYCDPVQGAMEPRDNTQPQGIMDPVLWILEQTRPTRIQLSGFARRLVQDLWRHRWRLHASLSPEALGYARARAGDKFGPKSAATGLILFLLTAITLIVTSAYREAFGMCIAGAVLILFTIMLAPWVARHGDPHSNDRDDALHRARGFMNSARLEHKRTAYQILWDLLPSAQTRPSWIPAISRGNLELITYQLRIDVMDTRQEFEKALTAHEFSHALRPLSDFAQHFRLVTDARLTREGWEAHVVEAVAKVTARFLDSRIVPAPVNLVNSVLKTMPVRKGGWIRDPAATKLDLAIDLAQVDRCLHIGSPNDLAQAAEILNSLCQMAPPRRRLRRKPEVEDHTPRIASRQTRLRELFIRKIDTPKIEQSRAYLQAYQQWQPAPETPDTLRIRAMLLDLRERLRDGNWFEAREALSVVSAQLQGLKRVDGRKSVEFARLLVALEYHVLFWQRVIGKASLMRYHRGTGTVEGQSGWIAPFFIETRPVSSEDYLSFLKRVDLRNEAVDAVGPNQEALVMDMERAKTYAHAHACGRLRLPTVEEWELVFGADTFLKGDARTNAGIAREWATSSNGQAAVQGKLQNHCKSFRCAMPSEMKGPHAD